jgi:hypothetical protein
MYLAKPAPRTRGAVDLFSAEMGSALLVLGFLHFLHFYLHRRSRRNSEIRMIPGRSGSWAEPRLGKVLE